MSKSSYWWEEIEWFPGITSHLQVAQPTPEKTKHGGEIMSYQCGACENKISFKL